MLKYHPVFPIIVLSKGKWGEFFMKVNNTDKVMGIYLNNMNNQVREKKVNHTKKDKISISEEAKDFQFALELIKKLPDTRAEKVERLKREVQAGTYNVDGKKIAEKMLESIYFDKRI